jgi:hypothetical protein
MRVEVVELEPETARDWLLRSSDQPQRSLSIRRVDRIAHDIVTGQWKMTHQPIALDKDGVVIDGQHRLSAIAKSRMKVPVLVAFDADRDTFDVIDTGQARTTADTLKIAGYGNSAHVAAAARMLIAYDEVKGKQRTLSAVLPLISTPDTLKLLESPRGDELLDVIPYASQIAGAWGRYGTRTWLAAGLQVLKDAGVSKQTVSQFGERLRDGAMLQPGSPVLSFRRFVMSDTGLVRTVGSLKATVGLATFIKTFNRFHLKEASQLTTFRPGIERMPLVVLPGGDISQERRVGEPEPLGEDADGIGLEAAAAS